MYKAILPDTSANEFSKTQILLEKLTLKIRQELPKTDISEVMEEVADLLDESIITEEFMIAEKPKQLIDLSELTLKQLETKFQTGYKHTEAEKLKVTIQRKLKQMTEFKRRRTSYI